MSTNPAQPDRPADEQSGPPYRAIAMVLLTAVVALVVIGMIQLFSGDDDTPAAGSEETPTAEQQSPGADQNGAESPAPPATDPDEGQEVPPPSPEETPAPDEEPPAPDDPRAVPVVVYNNSTVQGLASQTGDQLEGAGYNVADTTNLASDLGIVPTTTVMYGPGPGEQQAAEAIAQEFGYDVAPKPGNLDLEPGLAIIVTG